MGHFCADYNTAIRKGFAAIKAEAEAKIAEIEERGIFGDSIEQYNFYRAIAIVCEGMIIYTKRYAKLAAELAARERTRNAKKNWKPWQIP